MAAGHPAQAALRRAVRTCVAGHDATEAPNTLVLAAVSGGADSLALAHALLHEGGPARTGVVVVDHDLQPGSAEVAARAAEQCRAMRTPDGRAHEVVDVRRVRVASTGAGPEADAREARYAALAAAAGDLDAALVLLGHTRDDQAEQVLLGLLRGSGARSLAGMPATTTRGGVPFARPLLQVDRATTRAACAAAGLDPWHDPTNVDPAFARSRARAVLATLAEDLGPGLPEALARTADLLRADADHLDALADEASAPFAAVAEPRTADLAALPTALRTRVLRRLLLAGGARPGDLSAAHLAAVDALVTAPRGRGPLHLPGVEVTRLGTGRQARLSITGAGLV
ncbi:tRNA lysidine(34) synthetase TilS [Janibacter melonis]|uniref:tRNA lysidine(34) synthetase TilS n=1 Tax=Janibacter melonis TaxID=262209 RepID=UPI001E3307EF|nr:tRNA lysidine(34) synthetase TilS [Janibacter melonis]MCB5992525.1 tRNA lysidine(34) synthetase TilS [Janibacter melonis]